MADKFLLPEDVVDFALALRQAGYSVGADQCIAANRLLVTLAAHGTRFPDLWQLRTWLAPVFCGSPSEQADFDRHYRNWLDGRGEFTEVAPVSGSQGDRASAAAAPKVGTSHTRRWMVAAAVVLILAATAALAYDVYYRSVVRMLRGRVIDDKDAAVAGASIKVGDRSLTTDQKGAFTLTFRLLHLPLTVTASDRGFPSPHTIDARNWKQPLIFRLATPSPTQGVLDVTGPQRGRLDLTPTEMAFLEAALKAELQSQGGSSPTPKKVQPASYLLALYRHYYWSVFVLATLSPLLLVGFWMFWVYLPRLQLIRWKSEEEPRLDALRVKGVAVQLFNSVSFRRMAQQLRRHRQIESTDLDPDRTVIESARRGGWFTPAHLLRKSLPDYLLLVDRVGFRDLQPRLLEELVRRLRLDNVDVDCYHFYGDPRICYAEPKPATGRGFRAAEGGSFSPAKGPGFRPAAQAPKEFKPAGQASPMEIIDISETQAARSGSSGATTALLEPEATSDAPSPKRLLIEDLAALHGDHHLLIFSDASKFFGSLTGRPQPWIDRFSLWSFRTFLLPESMFGPETGNRVRMLEDCGFLALPATESGLAEVAKLVHADSAERAGSTHSAGLGDVRQYPDLLGQNDSRWLGEIAPEPSTVSLLIGQLRAYLGRDGFHWLCACAVYPQLLWDLTLYLGHEMGPLGLDEQRLAALLRLPWFRQGSMPDWLRERLVAALPPQKREAVREFLRRLLLTALEEPLDGFELPYAKDGVKAPRRFTRKFAWARPLLRNFIRTEPLASPLRDYVFLSVLHGRKPGKGFPVPRELRRLWTRYGQPRRPLIQAVTALVASVTVCLGMLRFRPTPRPTTSVQPLPNPTGPYPYHLSLNNFLTTEEVKSIEAEGQMEFQVTGNTGGIENPRPQEAVAAAMAAQFPAPAAYRSYAPRARPLFLYLLGNLVYYNGEDSKYYDQFYKPYKDYPAPIFAIPGNRDGDPLDGQSSLQAFVANFCATRAVHTPDAGGTARTAMTQPNPYWTLETPLATIIGLYTNVPEGGYVDDQQRKWLASELKNAPSDKALIVAMHYPIYSATEANTYLAGLLDQAMLVARRAPDLVLAAHVNNYQRFTRSLGSPSQPSTTRALVSGPGRQLPIRFVSYAPATGTRPPVSEPTRKLPLFSTRPPVSGAGRGLAYIVVGVGGYPNLQRMPSSLQVPAILSSGVTLDSFDDTRHGFLRLTVTRSTLTVEYFAVGETTLAGGAGTRMVDSLTLDLRTNQPAQIEPVPSRPGPSQESQIQLGQTTDQVVSALGQPEKIVDLGTKKIYVYKDLKITFTDGKVSDVHAVDRVGSRWQEPLRERFYARFLEPRSHRS